MSIGFILPSVFPKWFTPAGDAVLSGGSLEFYDVGTTTPKSVYADYQRSVAIGAVVTLDSAGDATIFLGDGGYKVILKDESGAQLDLVDGIFTGGGYGILGSNASIGFFKLYEDLRAVTVGPDVAYVCGRTAEGDGGQGLFQLIPGSSTPDDDGVHLVAAGGAYVYKRIFDESINPEWYGVKYNIASDQSSRFNAAVAASVYLNFPVLVTAQVYLGANTTIPSNASLRNTEDGYFNSPSSVTMTFSSGSRFSGNGPAFRSAVQPIFVAGTIDALRLSWFGGADSDKWARCLASTAAAFPLLMDVSTSLTSDLTIPANLAFEPVGGAVVTFGAFASLSIASLNYAGLAQFAAWTLGSYVGSVSIASPVCYMEWFGGSPSNSGNDNAIPFKACCFARRLDLREGFTPTGTLTYTVTSSNPFTFSDFMTWEGRGSKLILNQAITVMGIFLNNIILWGSGSITHSSCVATKTTSIVPLLNGPTTATDSNLSSVFWLLRGENSTLSGITQMDGRFNNCTIGTEHSINVIGNSRFEGGTIQSVSNKPVFILSNEYDRFEFVGCAISCPGALFYCEDPTISVILNGCTNSAWSNSQAIHNGIATVHAIGCGFVRNSSVNSIDGVDLDSVNMIKGGADSTPIVFSSTTTPWRAPVSLTSDGTYIVTGENAALSSDPYTTQTIRAIAYDVFYVAWRYGGVIDVDVVFPTGTTPDPDKRIGMMFVMPPTANVATVGVNAIGDGDKFCCNPAILGAAPWVRMPAKEAAPMRCVIPVWGGQIDMRAVPEVHPTYTVADIWGDKSTSVPSGTDTRILEFGRLVIYGVDDGVLIPAGTKIKASYRPVLPKTVQYEKFFPDHKPTQYASSDYYMFAPLSYQAIRIRTSLTGSGLGQTQLAVPFMYRAGDYNGVQASLARKSSDPISPVQWNGATLSNGWS